MLVLAVGKKFPAREPPISGLKERESKCAVYVDVPLRVPGASLPPRAGRGISKNMKRLSGKKATPTALTREP